MNFTHFFVQGLQSGAQPVEVSHGFYRFYNADFIDGGKRLLINASIDSSENPDRSRETEIYLADSLGNDLRLLLGEKNWAYSSALASPSGKWIAYQKQHVSSVSLAELFIMSANGTERFSIPFDRSKGSLSWSQDEKYLYFVVSSNGGYPLCRVDLQTRKIERLTDFDHGIGSFDIKGNHLVYARTAVDDPSELYSADLSLQDSRPISAFNRDWLKNKQLSIPEKHEYRNSMGATVEYWVMKPLNYAPGNKYPVLLEIHGGPSAMWGPGESTMWHEFQFYCSRGYGVVYCNPRGSGGYGQDFLRANIKDWGAGPSSDVLGALDRTIAEGWTDTTKLLITGGSYAGYLVAWIIAHDHRFLAACSQRGVYDLATFFGEGNAWELVPDYFGGYPWEPDTKAILQRESPITYVQQINTPYVIFHGENDRRTGFVQSEMLYRSLKVLGRNVEYVRHPGASNEITRSGDNRKRMDQMLRTYEFFERWLRKNIHS
jgi:dipeptidyl aminopeptidase/acylaminoacyl peptidase